MFYYVSSIIFYIYAVLGIFYYILYSCSIKKLTLVDKFGNEFSTDCLKYKGAGSSLQS